MQTTPKCRLGIMSHETICRISILEFSTLGYQPPILHFDNNSCNYLRCYGWVISLGWGGSGSAVNIYSRLTHLLKFNSEKKILMKLTIDEALQKGVTAYRQGKFQHAERLYRAILQTQPEHPDANYNLGILAISANKADAALPLFKAALTANPKKEKFWFSYIDALIKDKKFESAKRVIDQVKSKGMASDKLTVFEKKILSQNRISGSQSAPQKKNLTFATKRKRITEAKKTAKRKKSPIAPLDDRRLYRYYRLLLERLAFSLSRMVCGAVMYRVL